MRRGRKAGSIGRRIYFRGHENRRAMRDDYSAHGSPVYVIRKYGRLYPRHSRGVHRSQRRCGACR